MGNVSINNNTDNIVNRMSSIVEVEITEKIAFVRLNRAEKLNAINLNMFIELASVARKLRHNKDIRAIIVSGNGPEFCTGLDVKELITKQESVFKLLFKLIPGKPNKAQQVSYLWRQIPVPVIFAIHGKCWGGGMQIALGGDFRIAHSDSSFAIMEAKWGLIPDMGGTLALREHVRKDIALQLTMTGEVINASYAQEIGLITKISDEPINEAIELANLLSERSPDTVAANKILFNKLWFATPWRWLAWETIYQIRVFLGKNVKVAIKRQQRKEGKALPSFIKRKFK